MRRPWQVIRGLIEALAVALALGSAAAAVGAQGGRWNDRLDLLTHFALIWLAAGLAALLLSWASPSRWRGWSIRALAILAIVAAGGLILPDFTRPVGPRAPAGAPHQVRIVEFNAWGANSDPDLVAAWIASQHPDLVVVIEATAALKETIEATTGLQTSMSDGLVVATRRQPLEERVGWSAHLFPGQGFSANWPRVQGFDGRSFAFVGVHMGWPIPSWRRRSEDLHLSVMLDQDDRSRTIMVGDFNSTQWSFRHRMAERASGLERRDRALPTWPARASMLQGRPFPAPLLAIDHIYAGALWRTVRVERGPRLGSDHYPLVATLAWVGPVSGDPALWPAP